MLFPIPNGSRRGTNGLVADGAQRLRAGIQQDVMDKKAAARVAGLDSDELREVFRELEQEAQKLLKVLDSDKNFY
jgi:hypothetical protein